MLDIGVEVRLHSSFSSATSPTLILPLAGLNPVSSSWLRAKLPLHGYDVKCSSFSSLPWACPHSHRDAAEEACRSVQEDAISIARFVAGGAPEGLRTRYGGWLRDL